MLEKRKIVDVGSTQFRNIVGINFSKVRIILGEVCTFLEFEKDGNIYRTRNSVSPENPQHVWRTIFPGGTIHPKTTITSIEDVETDDLMTRGLYDPSNESIHFIAARS